MPPLCSKPTSAFHSEEESRFWQGLQGPTWIDPSLLLPSSPTTLSLTCPCMHPSHDGHAGLLRLLEHSRCVLTSGPLHVILPVRGTLPPDICMSHNLTSFVSLLRCHVLVQAFPDLYLSSLVLFFSIALTTSNKLYNLLPKDREFLSLLFTAASLVPRTVHGIE